MLQIVKIQSSPAIMEGTSIECSDPGTFKKSSVAPISFSLITSKVDDQIPLSARQAWIS